MENNKNTLFITLIVLVICAEFFFNFFLENTKIESIPPLIAQKIECDAPLSNIPASLILYVTDSKMGFGVADYLCNSADIAKQYGNVHLVIGQSDYDTFRYINYGIADLALVKENAANAFNATQSHNLQPISSYSDYEAYFIALREKPQLTKEYFLDKKIGLLDYPTSRSGHIAPKSTFKELDINEAALDIHYYNSHHELREKLIQGEVDIIASYWNNNDAETLSSSYITRIELTFSGVKWYLKNAAKNQDLNCVAQQAIKLAGQLHHSNYYAAPEWLVPCEKSNEESL